MGHYERDINGNYIWVDDSGNRKQVTNEGTIASNVGTKKQAIARQAAAQKQSEKKKAESREYRNSTNEIGRITVTGAHQDPVTKEIITEEGYDPKAVNVIGMSGRDPLLGTAVEWIVGGKILGDVGKGLYYGLNKYAVPALKSLRRGRLVENNLTSHLQGDDAIKMFKEYGGEVIPKNSINGEQLRKYVAEARERYGLVGDTRISDEEIAEALYKHSKELGGNTAAVNAQGEPQLLFRGSTKRNAELHPKGTAEQPVSGADNILGNLFLGELPGTRPGQGLERYLGLKQGWLGPIGPQTRAAEVIGDKVSYPLYETSKFGLVEKLAPESMEFGANDINAFIVRTPKVRNGTEEVVVINGLENIPKEKLLGQTHAEHYRNLIKDMESKREGLLRSDPAFREMPIKNPISGETITQRIPKFRDEHEYYTYFALPNFNIRNAKHLLPYDLRIPRNWNSNNIYKSILYPTLVTTPAYYISKQKQGGKFKYYIPNKKSDSLI